MGRLGSDLVILIEMLFCCVSVLSVDCSVFVGILMLCGVFWLVWVGGVEMYYVIDVVSVYW